MAQNSDPNDIAAHGEGATFDVLLTGVRVGAPLSEATASLAALFKATPAQIAGLLDNRSHVVKQGCTPALAAVYRAAIEKAGGSCELVERARPTLIVDASLFQAPPTSEATVSRAPTAVPAAPEPLARHVDAPVASQHQQVAARAFCSSCGTGLTANSAFCANCGTAVSPSINETPLPTQAPQTAPAGVSDAIQTFVGKNYEYFNSQWEIAERTKNKARWNWAAFFGGIVWLAYRKMYLYACICAGLAIVVGIAEEYFNAPNAFSRATNTCFVVVIGLLGNSWYKTHTAIKIKEISTVTTPERIHDELIRQGGTSVGAALAFAFGVVLFVIWLAYTL